MGFIPPDVPPEKPDLIRPGVVVEWVEGGRFNFYDFAESLCGLAEAEVAVLRGCDGLAINRFFYMPRRQFEKQFRRVSP